MNKQETQFSRGKDAEAEFARLIPGCRKASEQEDIHLHFDLMTEEGETYDVKALKAIKRGGMFQEGYHYVEIKNVHGDLGWLYGQADYLAFECWDYFIVADRMKLKLFVESRVEKEYVTNPERAVYKLYRRKGRSDIMTLVKALDMIAFCDATIVHKLPEMPIQRRCEALAPTLNDTMYHFYLRAYLQWLRSKKVKLLANTTQKTPPIPGQSYD